jgi:predicted amidohydrolase YtcJ
MRTLVALIASALLSVQQAPSAPDIAIVNARVFTGDAAAPWAEAVSISGARITRVGSTAEVRAAAGANTQVIDANGRLLIPGINDAHAHPAAHPDVVRLEGPPAVEHDPSLDEVIARLRAAVGKAAPGQWIVGEIGAAVLEDPRATRATLDPATDGHPLMLTAWTGHGTIANTTALRILGIKENEPDPPGGFYARQADGRSLTGLAREYAEYDLRRRFTMLPDRAEQVRAFAAYTREAAALGITSVQAMMSAYPTDAIAQILASADLSVRMRLIDFPLTPVSAWREPISRRIKTHSPMVTVSGTKWILDGTPVERGMLLLADYSDAAGVRGRRNVSDADLRAFLRRALAAHEQPLVHAVGDGAIAAVLDALEATGGEAWKPLRPRIEHGDMLQVQDFPRAARMGVTIVQNPAHFMIPAVFTARVGPERLARSTQVKAIVQAGVPFAIGTDGPMNPFLNIMFATINANNPSQALTIEQALRAYTSGSAAAEFAEREKGMLKAGMLADMALLSQDIFRVPPSDLPRTVSILTIVNGKVVHSAAQQPQRGAR